MMSFETNIYQDKKSTGFSAPAIDTRSHDQVKQRKSSVTFDLPPTPSNEEERELGSGEQELLSPCPASCPTVDICAHSVPDTMLVALFDRSSEMKGLVRHNRNYFSALQHHLDAKWSRFENTLYCDRSKMPDIEWMSRISKALQSAPSLLEKFKDLVGYMGETEDEDEDEDDDTTSTGDGEFFASVDISRIRNYPNRISKESYPQFYINCQQFMQEAEFEQFVNTLSSTDRKEISDELWESKIYKQLHDWPNLLEQLQELVAYEIEEEDR